MAVSTNTRFAVAVHVLTYLAGVPEGCPVSSGDLSDSTNASAVYVRRVLGPLRDAGLVRSRPGLHGGWELAPNGRDATLARVWTLLQDGDPLLGLHGPNPACGVGRSVQRSLEALDRRVIRAVTTELENVTIGDLVMEAATEPA